MIQSRRISLAMCMVLAGTCALYFRALDSVPVVVAVDEARFALHGHSIATRGTDLAGNRWPLFFHITDPLNPTATDSETGDRSGGAGSVRVRATFWGVSRRHRGGGDGDRQSAQLCRCSGFIPCTFGVRACWTKPAWLRAVVVLLLGLALAQFVAFYKALI